MDENNDQNYDNQPNDDYSSHIDNQTKLCRYCRFAIDVKATICPNCRKYQKDNTPLVLIIAVVSIIIFMGPDIYSIGKDIMREFYTESDTKSTAVEEYPQPVSTHTLIYDNNGIKIYYNGMSSNMLGVSIAFQAENNTNENVTIHVDDFSLNNYTFKAFCYIDVVKGTMANKSIIIDNYEMAQNNLDYSKLNRCKLNFEISTESDILGKETEMIEFNLR